ncbi:MAG TPA: 50S ribosomal protein L25 [Longimicrobium sp.]|nr:50S ribosomal protein L25 [Longimicrobium sp.]
MAVSATLKAAPRGTAGKGTARKLRAAGQVPAVLYGQGEKPRPLSVNAHDLGLLVAAVNVENTLVRLDIEGEGPKDVLLREVQMHPYKPEALHVDFFHVTAGEKIHVKIPVRLVGTPVGVHTDGGVLDQVLYDLDVECLPGNIPDAVEIDVSNLGIGESVRVSEIPAREGVKFLQDGDLPIASIVGSHRPEEEDTAAADEAAEPEVLRARKGDEEE